MWPRLDWFHLHFPHFTEEEEEEKEEEEREKEAGVGEGEDLYLRFYGVFSSAFLVEEILIGAALYNRWGIWRCNYQSSLVQRERYIPRLLYPFITFRLVIIKSDPFFYKAVSWNSSTMSWKPIAYLLSTTICCKSQLYYLLLFCYYYSHCIV